MKKEFIYLIVVALICLGFLTKSHFDNKRWEKIAENYREMVIKSDSLRQDDRGIYMKLANDMHSEKTLRKLLEEENSDLATSIRKDKSQIRSLTQLVASLRDKEGEQDLPDTAFDSVAKTITFTSFYPDQDNIFATFSGVINTRTKKLIEKWEFEDIPIDLVLTETEDGLFELKSDVPDFLTISDIKVDMLPTEDEKGLGNFGWIVGGGYKKLFTSDGNKVKEYDLNVGARFKQFTLLGEVGTIVGDPRIDGAVGLKLLYEFK